MIVGASVHLCFPSANANGHHMNAFYSANQRCLVLVVMKVTGDGTSQGRMIWRSDPI